MLIYWSLTTGDGEVRGLAANAGPVADGARARADAVRSRGAHRDAPADRPLHLRPLEKCVCKRCIFAVNMQRVLWAFSGDMFIPSFEHVRKQFAGCKRK